MDPQRDPWSTEDEVITVGFLGALPAMVVGSGVYLWVRQFGGPWAKQLEPHMAISLQAAAGLTAVGAVFATIAACRYLWSRGLIGEAVTDASSPTWAGGAAGSQRPSGGRTFNDELPLVVLSAAKVE